MPSALTVIGFTTAAFLIGASIAASLAFYFVHKGDYKNAEASAIFSAILSAVSLILFILMLVKENQIVGKLKSVAKVGATIIKMPQADRDAFLAQLNQKAGPAAVAAAEEEIDEA